MQALGYISHSINDLLQPANTVTVGYSGMGAPGDTYIVTDTRSRSVKDLDKLASLQRYKIEKYDGDANLTAENGVVLVPVLDLNFDTKNFQNRDSEYSEASVNRIIDAVDDGDFNWAVFDPITIWRNPTDGKYYVLSGHSRSEAFRRLAMSGKQADGRKFDRIPAKVFEGTFEQAKELALNSNTLSTKETDLERANYYRERRAKLLANGLKTSEVRKRLLELARKNEGKNATKIIYLSYLKPNGFVVDAVSQTADGASVDKNRVAVMAEWVGHLRHDFPQLTDAHEVELFNFLKNGHYGVDVRNFADFAQRVSTAIEKHTEWGNFDATKSLNLEKNLGKSENEKRYDAELLRLKQEWSDAENVLNRKLSEFKARQRNDASITNAAILKAVQPYKDAAIMAKAAYLAFRDKRGEYLKADEAQMSLFGVRGSAPFGISCLGNLCTGSDLGKPTIKFEFETNSELADFLKDTQKAAEFAETINPEGSAQPAADTAPNTNRRRNQKAITTDTPLSLMPGGMTPGLPPSPTSPKALPPSDGQQTPPLPAFNKVFENPDEIYFDKRRIGDYGYINDNLRYINFYIDKNWTFDRNILKFAEKIFPGAVIIICFVDNNGQWRFYIDKKKYRDFLSKHLPKHLLSGLNYVVLYEKDGGIQTVERLIKAFEAEGKNVVLIYRHIVDGVVEMPQASTPAALPPASTPAPVQSTPDIVVPVQKQQDKSPFADLKDAYQRSLYWGSFDPEGRTRRDFEGYDAMYNRILPSIPDDKRDDFTAYFRNKISNIISLQSKAPNAAVTGGGGISARKAARYNAANDRLMEAYGTFSDDIERYAKRFIKRAESRDTDAIVNKIKWDIDNLIGIIKRKEPYSIPLLKSNLANRIITIAEKGNVEAIEKILAYLRPTGLYTNRHQIWRTLDAAKGIAERQKMFENYEASQPDNGKWHVEYDTDEDRVKIIFEDIPSVEAREWLKKNGFHWSPRNKAWQRQITDNARYAVERFRESGLGKPTIKLEFENNGELLSLFDAGTINGDKEPAAIFNCPESQLDCKGYRPTYKILPSYDHLIDPADGQSKLVGYGFEEATLSELIEACKYYRQVARLAQHLKGADALQTAFNIWHFLHTNVRYNYDAPGLEEIRVPARVWADRFSGVDCDCLAVFTACLLLNLGYRPQFEIVGFDNSPKYSHIYVTLDGYPIDRVLPSFLDRPKNITKTKIMDIPVYQLSGCDLHGGLSGIYDSTLRRIATGTASAQDCLDFRKAQVLVSLQGNNPDAATLAEILMPYVGVVADDGAYYFTNANVAKVATEADSELRQMQSQNLAGAPLAGWFDIVRQKVKAASEDVIINNPQCNAPTIVVIINPKREKVQVKGEMVKADLPSVNPLQSEPTLFTATLPESEAANEAPAEKKGSNVLWWALGVVGLTTAAVCMNEKKGKKK